VSADAVWTAEEYEGEAVVRAQGREIPVQLKLSGRFEPVDGRYHWGGRIAPQPDIERLARSTEKDVTVQVGRLAGAPARLAEVDPWGGVRVQGLSRPPWAQPPREGLSDGP